ncbi:hypothetical protein EJD97_020005 [Solanum chilense]|uniref:Uncharacterized protein n=1 Tax=Solanum chilense TaxID=4083 RepID=A0A6N2AXZ1_SOLCI|nr:hypothetical protein EJD97_020005 [Solanum chilense]
MRDTHPMDSHKRKPSKWNMNTRRTTSRRVKEGLVNEGVPPRGEQAPIASQENVNEAVPSQVPRSPQAPNVEGDMSNVDIRDAFQVLT